MVTLKSPCLDCIIHRRKLDKTDPRYPCELCAVRLAYAESVTGIAARFVDDDVYEIHGEGLDVFEAFDDGLRISDIAYY